VKTSRTQIKSLTWVLLASAAALVLAVGLSLLLSSYRALAQPTAPLQDLEVQKEVSAAQAAPGDTLVYTITIRNTTASSISAQMTDTLPVELYDVSGPSALLPTSEVGIDEHNVITWSCSLSALQYDVVTVSALITDGIMYAEVVNTAEITGGGELISDSATTAVVGNVGNLDNEGTYKTVSKAQAEPGDVLTYTIRIENDDALYETPGAVFTDRVPEGTTLVYGPESLVGDVGFQDGVITWTYDVPPLGYDEISFSVQISPDLTGMAWITNAVEIAAPGQSFTRAAGTRVSIEYFTYFPIMFQRWPPIPYSPFLHEISGGIDGDYTVSWEYDPSHPDEADPDSYTLQEARDANFTDDVKEYDAGSNLSYDFNDQESGSYYYRVRGNNTWGPGEWSNVRSVNVWSYSDDFSDYKSGWPREWSKTRFALYQVRPNEQPGCPGSDCQYDDGDGYVIGRRSGSKPYARFGPGVKVPSEDYEMELDARWWDYAYFATYQIFFGADDDFDKYYSVEVRANDAGSSLICEYRVVKGSNGSETELNGGWSYSAEIHCGKRRTSTGNTSWNHWRIRRDDDWINVYVNGHHLGGWHDSSFGADRYFGVGATLYEGFTPGKPEFDDWVIELLN